MSTTLKDYVDDVLPVEVFEGDLDERSFSRALGAPLIAWDTETTGLDWRSERIAIVQLKVDESTFVVRVNGRNPPRLKALLEDPTILKIFHHAMFDLRFMAHYWDATPLHVACTKIASKLVNPETPCSEHSLGPLVDRYLGVKLDKGLQTSDWTGDLTAAQLRYAADDVRYLPDLYAKLDREIRRKGLLDLRERCYAHLRTLVELDVGGFPDVFAY
jgi:ribonuclease D